jgi:hypothetical protein
VAACLRASWTSLTVRVNADGWLSSLHHGPGTVLLSHTRVTLFKLHEPFLSSFCPAVDDWVNIAYVGMQVGSCMNTEQQQLVGTWLRMASVTSAILN